MPASKGKNKTKPALTSQSGTQARKSKHDSPPGPDLTPVTKTRPKPKPTGKALDLESEEATAAAKLLLELSGSSRQGSSRPAQLSDTVAEHSDSDSDSIVITGGPPDAGTKEDSSRTIFSISSDSVGSEGELSRLDQRKISKEQKPRLQTPDPSPHRGKIQYHSHERAIQHDF
jgi:hypothetical protein